MKKVIPSRILVVCLVSLFVIGALLAASTVSQDYFCLGPHLVQGFQGSYEFKQKRLEFTRTVSSGWMIKSSGDESPRQDELIIAGGYVNWIRGGSEERLLKVKVSFQRGDEWQDTFRGVARKYKVADTDMSVSVPAGRYEHCAKVVVSWVESAPDVQGSRRMVLYLAPHLGIIKREQWSDGAMWHEEVLTKHTPAEE